MANSASTPGESCQEVWPSIAGSCGVFGRCDFNKSSCVCNVGWSQSTEFGNVFENPLHIYCDYNEHFLMSLYIILLVLSTIALAFQLIALQTKAQFIRLMPALISFLLTACFSAYRLSGINSRRFAEDFAFTLLVTLASIASSVAAWLFFEAYFSYMMKSIEWTPKTKDRVQNFRKITKYLEIFYALVYLTWPASVFLDRRSAGRLIRASMGIISIRFVFVGVTSHFLFKQFIQDLIKMDYNGANGFLEMNKERSSWIKRHIPKVKQMSTSIRISSTIGFFLNFLLSGIESWYITWMYALPLLSITSQISSILVIKSRYRGKARSQRDATRSQRDATRTGSAATILDESSDDNTRARASSMHMLSAAFSQAKGVFKSTTSI